MKDPFRRVIGEIKRTISELFFFELMVNTVLMFLSFYFILLVIALPGWYAFIPASLYFAIELGLIITMNKPLIVEHKHIPLREKLRTAIDNMQERNPIVQELEFEIVQEMQQVQMSQFFNAKGISYKILIITLLSFGIIFTSTLNLQFFDAADFVFGEPDRKTSKGAGDFEAVELASDEEIYGDDNVADLGDKELDIKIKPVDFKIAVKEEGEVDVGEFTDIFPKDVYVKESEESQERIPKEQQELVKNYFSNRAKS